MSFRSEFGEFISKGNVIDLAVGVVIGAAFGKIVTSLVDDILMPPIGMAIGGVDFSELKVVLRDAVMEGGKVITPAVSINYGNFLQTIIQFLIIALAIFIFVVKPINIMRKRRAAAEAAPPEVAAAAPSEEVLLLTQIRDSLRKP